MTGGRTIYENHLKGAYSVASGDKSLAITDTSCYRLNEETAWLVAELPGSGGEEEFLASLSGLGLNEPGKIFGRLRAIGVLKKKEPRGWRGTLRAALAPRIKLIPARLQEGAFRLLSLNPGVIKNNIYAFSALSLAGLVWGAVLLAGGPAAALQSAQVGANNGLAVFLLVIASSLVHELGHSFCAAAAGIGFRPVGFSVYLIYPVFFTNVSGIDKLGLKEKALIDCGGFILQYIFVLFLLVFGALSSSPSAAEAARWITAIVLFNMNPFLRTDGYWLYKDVYSELKSFRWARAAHYLYLALFFAFSVYFLWLVASRLGWLWQELGLLARSPGQLFSGGYRAILGVYFALIGLAGGLNRFKEGGREWQELRRSGQPDYRN